MKVYLTHMRQNLGIDGLFGYTNLSAILILLLLNLFFLFKDIELKFSPSLAFWGAGIAVVAWSIANAVTFRKDNSARRLYYCNYLGIGKWKWLLISALTFLPLTLLEAVLTLRVLTIEKVPTWLSYLLCVCLVLFLSALFVIFSRSKDIHAPRLSSTFFPSKRHGVYAVYQWYVSRFYLTFLAIPVLWIFLEMPIFLEIAPEKILYLSACYIPLFSFKLSQTEQKKTVIKLNRYFGIQRRESVIAKGLLGSTLFLSVILPYLAMLVAQSIPFSIPFALVCVVYGIVTSFSLSVFFTRLGEKQILHDFATVFVAAIAFLPTACLLLAFFNFTSLNKPLESQENLYAEN